MSDDYAALITTIIMAELVIGSVQAYTLMKAWAEPTRQLTLRIKQAAEKVVTARKAGEDANPDDIALIRSARSTVEMQRLLMSTLPALAAAMVWMAACTVLVFVQIQVLKWSGTHTPLKDPKLARTSFYVSAGAVVLLVGEGVVRVFVRAYSGMLRDALSVARIKGEDREHLTAALAEHADRASGPEASTA
ncbi:hypothetical protein [Streptomyces sp. 900105245]